MWDPTHLSVDVLMSFAISIHGSRVGPDFKSVLSSACSTEFQSTGPVWDPTLYIQCALKNTVYFNPRVPCGTRPVSLFKFRDVRRISIHGSRVGPDYIPAYSDALQADFNPRVPCGTRHKAFQSAGRFPSISIHGSRVGPDIPDWYIVDRPVISIHGSRVGPDMCDL